MSDGIAEDIKAVSILLLADVLMYINGVRSTDPYFLIHTVHLTVFITSPATHLEPTYLPIKIYSHGPLQSSRKSSHPCCLTRIRSVLRPSDNGALCRIPCEGQGLLVR